MLIHFRTVPTDIPREVVLDRYLRNKISTEERAVYEGKADLETIADEGTRGLLYTVQKAVNDAYESQRTRIIARGKHPILHFDYVRAAISNAIAFQDEDIAFVALTLPIVDEVGRTCELLATSDWVSSLFNRGRPTDDERRQLFTAFFAAQIQFVACQELGHHFHGHCSDDGQEARVREEFGRDSNPRGSLEDQAKELDADGFAVHMMLRNFVAGSPRSKFLELLGSLSGESEDTELLALLVLAVGSFFFNRRQEFTENSISGLAHPLVTARMHFAMEEFVSWLTANRAPGASLITQARFYELMGAVWAALDPRTSARDWAEQTTFLLSANGARYLALLSETRSMLRTQMSTRCWGLLKAEDDEGAVASGL